MPTPLSDLALASAADVLAATEFVNLLAKQSPVPHHTSLNAGLGKWLLAVRERSEHKAIDAADGAKADMAGHPHEAEAVALIDLITSYTRALPATRTNKIYTAIAHTPFEPGRSPAPAAARQ